MTTAHIAPSATNETNEEAQETAKRDQKKFEEFQKNQEARNRLIHFDTYAEDLWKKGISAGKDYVTNTKEIGTQSVLDWEKPASEQIDAIDELAWNAVVILFLLDQKTPSTAINFLQNPSVEMLSGKNFSKKKNLQKTAQNIGLALGTKKNTPLGTFIAKKWNHDLLGLISEMKQKPTTSEEKKNPEKIVTKTLEKAGIKPKEAHAVSKFFAENKSWLNMKTMVMVGIGVTLLSLFLPDNKKNDTIKTGALLGLVAGIGLIALGNQKGFLKWADERVKKGIGLPDFIKNMMPGKWMESIKKMAPKWASELLDGPEAMLKKKFEAVKKTFLETNLPIPDFLEKHIKNFVSTHANFNFDALKKAGLVGGGVSAALLFSGAFRRSIGKLFFAPLRLAVATPGFVWKFKTPILLLTAVGVIAGLSPTDIQKIYAEEIHTPENQTAFKKFASDFFEDAKKVGTGAARLFGFLNATKITEKNKEKVLDSSQRLLTVIDGKTGKEVDELRNILHTIISEQKKFDAHAIYILAQKIGLSTKVSKVGTGGNMRFFLEVAGIPFPVVEKNPEFSSIAERIEAVKNDPDIQKQYQKMTESWKQVFAASKQSKKWDPKTFSKAVDENLPKLTEFLKTNENVSKTALSALILLLVGKKIIKAAGKVGRKIFRLLNGKMTLVAVISAAAYFGGHNGDKTELIRIAFRETSIFFQMGFVGASTKGERESIKKFGENVLSDGEEILRRLSSVLWGAPITFEKKAEKETFLRAFETLKKEMNAKKSSLSSESQTKVASLFTLFEKNSVVKKSPFSFDADIFQEILLWAEAMKMDVTLQSQKEKYMLTVGGVSFPPLNVSPYALITTKKDKRDKIQTTMETNLSGFLAEIQSDKNATEVTTFLKTLLENTKQNGYPSAFSKKQQTALVALLEKSPLFNVQHQSPFLVIEHLNEQGEILASTKIIHADGDLNEAYSEIDYANGSDVVDASIDIFSDFFRDITDTAVWHLADQIFQKTTDPVLKMRARRIMINFENDEPLTKTDFLYAIFSSSDGKLTIDKRSLVVWTIVDGAKKILWTAPLNAILREGSAFLSGNDEISGERLLRNSKIMALSGALAVTGGIMNRHHGILKAGMGAVRWGVMPIQVSYLGAKFASNVTHRVINPITTTQISARTFPGYFSNAVDRIPFTNGALRRSIRQYERYRLQVEAYKNAGLHDGVKRQNKAKKAFEDMEIHIKNLSEPDLKRIAQKWGVDINPIQNNIDTIREKLGEAIKTKIESSPLMEQAKKTASLGTRVKNMVPESTRALIAQKTEEAITRLKARATQMGTSFPSEKFKKLITASLGKGMSRTFLLLSLHEIITSDTPEKAMITILNYNLLGYGVIASANLVVAMSGGMTVAEALTAGLIKPNPYTLLAAAAVTLGMAFFGNDFMDEWAKKVLKFAEEHDLAHETLELGEAVSFALKGFGAWDFVEQKMMWEDDARTHFSKFEIITKKDYSEWNQKKREELSEQQKEQSILKTKIVRAIWKYDFSVGSDTKAAFEKWEKKYEHAKKMARIRSQQDSEYEWDPEEENEIFGLFAEKETLEDEEKKTSANIVESKEWKEKMQHQFFQHITTQEKLLKKYKDPKKNLSINAIRFFEEFADFIDISIKMGIFSSLVKKVAEISQQPYDTTKDYIVDLCFKGKERKK